MTERWLPVVGYERYEVSDQGRVRVRWTRKGSRPAGTILRSGGGPYPSVLLYDGQGNRATQRLHILVLTTFIGPCPEGLECCRHLDGDPTNNRLSNLRWGTVRENQADAIRHGTRPLGTAHHATKLSDENVRAIRQLLAQGTSPQLVASQYGVSVGHVRDIGHGRKRKYVLG